MSGFKSQLAIAGQCAYGTRYRLFSEFLTYCRQSGTNHIAEESALHDEVPGKQHNETLQARWLDPVWLEAKLDRGRAGPSRTQTGWCRTSRASVIPV